MPDRDEEMRLALDALTYAETALRDADAQRPLSVAERDTLLRRLESLVAVACAKPAAKAGPRLN